ncbi:hypothetical protein IL38_17710 [Actinopolyspora erythraea]|uniref:IucA/IucC family siderophore biosynthesis protein n=1 Tax=Actinopolyspora erythraea TaxID=414996 RepID=A0ABR4X122_9ACTN|nr:hypothetical protein IL38_17710 [Actinopolyspora erythraea]
MGDSCSPDAEEEVLLRELRARDARLAENCSAELPRARGDTTRRAFAALLRERLLPGAVETFRLPVAWGDGTSAASRLRTGRDAVRLLGPSLRAGKGELVLVRLVAGTLAAVCESGASFGLYRVRRPVLFDDGVTAVELDRPRRLVDALRSDPGTEPEAASWDRLREELADSARNLALSRAAVRRNAAAVALRAARLGTGDLLRTLGTGRSASEVTLDLDSLTCEGHNIHPCGMVRGGFSVADSVSYPAEAAGTVDVEFVALREGYFRSTPHGSGGSVGELLAEHFPEPFARARAALSERGRDPAEYQLVPVHPWQMRNAVPREYPAELASGAMLPLHEVRLPCRPTLSTRTLVTAHPGRHGRRLTVKTALDVLLTSARRTIAPESTRDGPRLSALLGELFARDSVLGSRAGIVPDLAGIAFEPPEGPSARAGRARGLSALLREDPADSLGTAEQAVTASALLLRSPVSGEPLLGELVSARARCHGVARPEAARWFLREYAEALLSSTLPLMSCYGIALEAHLQNVLVVVRGSRPVRLLLRDFAGVRIHPGRLRAAGHAVPTSRPGVTSVDDPSALHAKTCHATLQANLAEVVLLLQRSCALPGAVGWRIAREAASAVAARVGQRGGTALSEDLAALFAPESPQKALATMRLRPDEGEVYLPQPNPMSDPSPG